MSGIIFGGKFKGENMRFLTTGLLLAAALSNAAMAAVEQVRIALTGVQGEMMISWVTTESGVASIVKVGSVSGHYDGLFCPFLMFL
jgi:hypothetical protein